MGALAINRRLAWIFGVVVPVGELLRRRDEIGDIRALPLWIDDVALGMSLLLGAWAAGRNPVRGRAVLAAALGFACGMGAFSLSVELSDLTQAESIGLQGARVAIIKGALVALAVTGLVTTLRAKPENL